MFRSAFSKRFGLALAGLLIAISTAAAQGFEYEVSNELKSDIVHIRPNGRTTFAGIQDEFTIDLTSARFDVGVDLTFGFYDDDYRLAYDDADWYAAFRPIGFLEFALSKDYEFAGSYMYVEDDNVGGAKMGSNGFTIAFVGGGVTPVLDGLTVAFTMPFDNLGDDSDGVDGANLFDHFQFGFGAEYNFRDIFSIGAMIKSWDYQGARGYERTVGVSVSAGIFPVSGLSIYVGYSYQDYDGLCDVYGQNLLNFSISYEAARWAIGGDFLTNFGSHDADGYGSYFDSWNDDDRYDLYAALYGEFSLTRLFLIKLTLIEQFRFEVHDDWYHRHDSESLFTVSPGVEFQTGVGDFSVEVEVGIDNDGFASLGFPVKWTYEF